MSQRHYTDDDIRRWRAVWLGPRGFTWPWQASYVAWGLCLVIFTAEIVVEAITPIGVSMPPVWELCIAILAATLLNTYVDHDRPLRAFPKTLLQNLRSPRPMTRTHVSDPRITRVRIKDPS